MSNNFLGFIFAVGSVFFLAISIFTCPWGYYFKKKNNDRKTKQLMFIAFIGSTFCACGFMTALLYNDPFGFLASCISSVLIVFAIDAFVVHFIKKEAMERAEQIIEKREQVYPYSDLAQDYDEFEYGSSNESNLNDDCDDDDDEEEDEDEDDYDDYTDFYNLETLTKNIKENK